MNTNKHKSICSDIWTASSFFVQNDYFGAQKFINFGYHFYQSLAQIWLASSSNHIWPPFAPMNYASLVFKSIHLAHAYPICMRSICLEAWYLWGLCQLLALIAFTLYFMSFLAFDVSADLTELSKTPVAVICAGVKSILDIGLTLEFLVR